MKYYLIAGESSGDLYGGLLLKELRRRDNAAQFKYWGGPNMYSEVHEDPLVPLEQTAFMGFWEVLKNYNAIRKLFQIAKESITAFDPDVIIFIDYPGFNLRMLKWAKLNGYKTCFYISPQLWAWKKNRYKILQSYADLFFVILPFEVSFFKKLNTSCTYHGHPLLEIIDHKTANPNNSLIGIFPGSRKQEIDKHLPVLLEFASRHPNKEFRIACVSHLDEANYLKHTMHHNNVSLHRKDSYALMKAIKYAITSSGTATLELALHKVPQIVIYKTSWLSYHIGKRLIDIPYISLVNLIAQKGIVRELIQMDVTSKNIDAAFQELLQNKNFEKITAAYTSIAQSLGDGNTSAKIAKDIYTLTQGSANQ